MDRALCQLLASGGKSGVIPELWQSSVVVPLEKGGDVRQGCYAVAQFLERVSVLRRVVLDEY